jgi:hypothetical protein
MTLMKWFKWIIQRIVMRTTQVKKLDDNEFMGPVTLRQLFLGVTDRWAQVLKSSALQTLEEELQAYGSLELDASVEELDYDIDSVVENVILE